MKLLLTSAGITNNTIASALDEISGITRRDIKIGFVPTAANIEPGKKDWFFRQLKDLDHFGYSWIDIIDFSANSIEWQQRLTQCDVVFISGGNTFHLLSQTKINRFDLWIKANIENKIFVGSSAGSILLTPTIEIATVEPADTNYSKLKDLSALHIVNFEISPHTPESLTYESNESYAKNSKYPLYAIDDNSALKVINDQIQIISEGQWKKY